MYAHDLAVAVAISRAVISSVGSALSLLALFAVNRIRSAETKRKAPAQDRRFCLI
jgi:hypothetical protein